MGRTSKNFQKALQAEGKLDNTSRRDRDAYRKAYREAERVRNKLTRVEKARLDFIGH